MTPEQCRAARGLLNWSQTELARRSGVARATIVRLETCHGGVGAIPSAATRIQQTFGLLRQTFEQGGVEFIQKGVKLA